jgi:hypothetical protein
MLQNKMHIFLSKGDGSLCLKYKKPGQKALSGLFICAPGMGDN